MSKWCVVATKQARERLASTQLENQNFSVFMPETKKVGLRAGRQVEQRAPLFPGYVFVEFEDSVARWRAVNGTLGVRALISHNEKPSLLPEGFVETMKANINNDGTIARHRFLEPGDMAAVLAGPLANQIGKLLEIDTKGRVEILLQLLSSKRPVKTRIENLIPV